LKGKGFSISDTVVGTLVKEQGYSLQVNRKEPAISKSHPDRDEQFEYINKKVKAYMKRHEAVLFIDAKKTYTCPPVNIFVTGHYRVKLPSYSNSTLPFGLLPPLQM
jgi:hypothetical protein